MAWIPLVQDDNCYPLWWIVNYGVVGREYTVSDALAAVYVDKNGGLYANAKISADALKKLTEDTED